MGFWLFKGGSCLKNFAKINPTGMVCDVKAESHYFGITSSQLLCHCITKYIFVKLKRKL